MIVVISLYYLLYRRLGTFQESMILAMSLSLIGMYAIFSFSVCRGKQGIFHYGIILLYAVPYVFAYVIKYSLRFSSSFSLPRKRDVIFIVSSVFLMMSSVVKGIQLLVFKNIKQEDSCQKNKILLQVIDEFIKQSSRQYSTICCSDYVAIPSSSFKKWRRFFTVPSPQDSRIVNADLLVFRLEKENSELNRFFSWQQINASRFITYFKLVYKTDDLVFYERI